MRLLLLLTVFALADCKAADFPVHTHGLDLSLTERTQLEQKAALGDGEAAFRLWLYHAIELHDDAGDPWLRRAAELKNPRGQYNLAFTIIYNKASPAGFGTNALAAVQSLLEPLAKTDGQASGLLASVYADGNICAPDYVKARACLQRAAASNYRSCWTKLSQYYRQGIGGPRDDAEAYYWIAIETMCVDPRSVGGQEEWSAREEIASHLSLPVLEREWKRIDAFMSRVTAKDFPPTDAPFGVGIYDPKAAAEGPPLAKQREDEHRKKCRARKD